MWPKCWKRALKTRQKWAGRAQKGRVKQAKWQTLVETHHNPGKSPSSPRSPLPGILAVDKKFLTRIRRVASDAKFAAFHCILSGVLAESFVWVPLVIFALLWIIRILCDKSPAKYKFLAPAPTAPWGFLSFRLGFVWIFPLRNPRARSACQVPRYTVNRSLICRKILPTPSG